MRQIQLICLFIRNNKQFIIYKTINISFVDKNKYQIKQIYKEKYYVNKNNFDKSIVIYQKIIRNRKKKLF